MSDAEWKCSELGYGEFLSVNPPLDRDADLQWLLHREYWAHAGEGHRSAIGACMRLARSHGVTARLYTDRTTKQLIIEGKIL